MFFFNGWDDKLTIVLSWRLFFDLEFFSWLRVLIVHELVQTKADVSTTLDGGRNSYIIVVFVN